MKGYCLIYILLTLFVSCSEARKEFIDNEIDNNPVQIKVEENILADDSILVIKPFAVGKPTRVIVGNPTITSAFTNISPAGKPIIVNRKIPEKIISGLHGNKLPEVNSAIIRKVRALNTPLKKALPPWAINGFNKTFEIIDIEQGLSSSNILTIFQDSRKNFWIGTSGEGLIKYNGINFLQFTSREGLPDNWVRAIIEDKSGNIWVGTDGGLAKYDGSDFYWIMNENDEHSFQIKMDIRSMDKDSKGNIWVGTANYGLFKFDGKNFTSYSINKSIGSYTSDIHFDKKGEMWFCGPGAGVVHYDGHSFTQYTQSHGLVDTRVNCINEDADGNLWFGTEKGISKFNRDTFTTITEKEGIYNKNVKCIANDSYGNIWIGTSNTGCSKYDGKSFSNYNLTEGLRSNVINSILQDNAGNLLFATGGGGIFNFRNNNFLTFGRQSSVNQSHITSICEDEGGDTWFGTFNGSLIKYDGENFYHYLPESGFNGKPITSILKDPKGDLWFGGLGDGLYKYDGTFFTVFRDTPNVFFRRINTLQVSDKESIWIGSSSKVLKFDGDSISGFTLQTQPKKEDIWSTLQDGKGNLWFGTHYGMLGKYDGRSVKFYKFSRNPIYSIIRDSADNIWVAQATNGLLKLDAGLNKNEGTEKIFLNYKSISDVNYLQIRSMTLDGKDDLWIGTNKGLVVLENTSSVPGNERIMRSFTKKDGLPGEEFVVESAFRDKKNRILWGTTQGMTMMDLNKMNLDTSPPVLQLSQISFNGKFADFHHLKNTNKATVPSAFKNIKFADAEKFYNYPNNPQIPFSLNHLTFNFVAIDWASPQRLKYSYKIDGLDNGWSELTEDAQADYRNIPYGNYIFKVKAIGAAQKWSTEFSYSFTILPPWWHTWWFRSLLLVAFVTAIYAYIKYRTHSLLKRQQFLQSTVEKRTEELRIALTDKEALLKEIHHRVKNNLEVISSLLMLQTKTVTDEKAKAGLIEGQSRVQSIALIHHKLYRTDDLGSVELIGFSKDLFKQIKDVFNQPGTRVDFYINETEIWLDTDAAVPFGLIFNELITNAFKYGVAATSENLFTMHATSKQEENTTHYHFVFRDNGPGLPDDFSLENTSSLGMKVIRLLTKQLVGTSKFYNDNGTVFELQFSKRNLPS